ncbi:MAG: DUF6110 family protein [Eubacteriales bacterium]
MYDWMKKDCNICLAVGLCVGLVATKILKAKKTRKFAVKAVAQGMMMKDSVMEEITNLKDEAMDIYEEAKVESVKACECECECDCQEEEEV